MNFSTTLLSSSTAFLGVAALALVSFQNPSQTPSGQHPSGSSGSTSPGAKPAQSPSRQDPMSSQGMRLQRADRLVGTDLSDSSGASLGRVQDLVLNSDGSVGFVVVQATVNGQAKLVPISWSALQFPTSPDSGAAGSMGGSSMGGKITTNFTKERLDSAPSFASNQWPKEGSDTVFTEADTFWGGRAATRTPASASGGAGEKDGRPIDASSMRTPVRLRSSTVGTMAITDPSGAPLGTLGEVVVDPASGRIAYATMSLSGGRTVAVPWSLFQTSMDKKDQLQLSFPQDKLQNAPQFQSGDENWKQMSDPAWVGQVYTYYSVPPYWKSNRAPAGTTPTPTGSEKQPPAGGQQPPPPKSTKPPGGG